MKVNTTVSTTDVGVGENTGVALVSTKGKIKGVQGGVEDKVVDIICLIKLKKVGQKLVMGK